MEMKRKVLACVLACAMLFLGMGYAYWTDSLQIDTAVTTGELDVRFVDLALFGQYPDEDGWAIFDGVDGDGFDLADTRWNNKPGSYNKIMTDEQKEAYEDRIVGYTETAFAAKLVNARTLGQPIGDNDYVSGTWSSDKIEISVTDMYPGYAQLFRADIVNPGTLAARLSELNVALNSYSNDDVKDMIGISLEVMREAGAEVINLLDGETDTFFIDGVEFVRLSALEAVYSDLQNNELFLYPSQEKDTFRMDLILGVAMDPDAAGVYTTGSVDAGNPNGNDDASTQNMSAAFTIQFGWDQFNTPEAPVPEA